MIDWARLAEMRDELGGEDFAEIAAMFLEDTQDAVDLLDMDGNLEGQLHYLKGSALTMGFVELAVLCSSGEAEAAAGRSDRVDLVEIGKAFRRAKGEFLTNGRERLNIDFGAVVT
ncbi:MAG: Hpt domain-containing protein [Pseudooceanicola sp.]